MYELPKSMKYIPQSKLKTWRQENSPDLCPIFGVPLNDSVVDHCHDTGMIRGVLHRQANAWEGKVYNAWRRYAKNNTKITFAECLDNLAAYLRKGGTQFLHPIGLVQLGKRFGRMKKEDQEFALKVLGLRKKEIKACINSDARVKIYKQLLKNL